MMEQKSIICRIDLLKNFNMTESGRVGPIVAKILSNEFDFNAKFTTVSTYQEESAYVTVKWGACNMIGVEIFMVNQFSLTKFQERIVIGHGDKKECSFHRLLTHPQDGNRFEPYKANKILLLVHLFRGSNERLSNLVQ